MFFVVLSMSGFAEILELGNLRGTSLFNLVGSNLETVGFTVLLVQTPVHGAAAISTGRISIHA